MVVPHVLALIVDLVESTGRHLESDGYLFLLEIERGRSGKLASKKAARCPALEPIVAEAMQAAGIRGEKITPHSLRHSMAIRYLQHGSGNVMALSKILGAQRLRSRKCTSTIWNSMSRARRCPACR